MLHNEPNYWKRTRVSRSTFIRGAGVAGAGLATAAFVGCGDDDDDATATATQPAGGTQTPGATQPAGGQPKPGGTLRMPLAGTSTVDPTTLFPFENVGHIVQRPSAHHYSRLLRGKAGPNIAATDYTAVQGDMAKTLPEQPDDVTYVFTLKPNIAFHDKAPMNGRLAKAQDFVDTYKYFIEKAINRGRFAAVIDKVEAPNDATIKITLKSPNATFIVNGAASDQGIWFIPVETINNDQIHSDPVGTGPWVFEKYEPGVRMVWNRHPKFHDAPEPYFSKLETLMNGDQARIMAALQSGDLDYSSLSGNQVADIKAKLDPKGQTIISPSSNVNGFVFNFDFKPWNDLRIRKALSMSIDRAGAMKALDPTGNTHWTSFIGPALVPHYIDPQDTAKFGPNSQFFKYDIAEAKKLLGAVMGNEKLDVNLISNVDSYGPTAKQQWELMAAMLRDVGFNPQNVYQDYGTYIQASPFARFTDPKAVGLVILIGTVLDPDDMFFTCYSSSSTRHNWSGTPIEEQAELDKMFVKQRGMLKAEERSAYIQDIQRTMAASFLVVPTLNPAGASYIQPWVKNAHLKVTYGTTVETFSAAYFDDARLKKG